MDLSQNNNLSVQPLAAIQFSLKSAQMAEKLKAALLISDSVRILDNMSGSGIDPICALLSVSKRLYSSAMTQLRTLNAIPFSGKIPAEERGERAVNAAIFIESRTRLSIDAAADKLRSAKSGIENQPHNISWSKLNGRGISLMLAHIDYRLSKGEQLCTLLSHYEISQDLYFELLKVKDFLHLARGKRTPAITLDGKISALIQKAAFEATSVKLADRLCL